MIKCTSMGCVRAATHVLVDKFHNIIDEGVFFCADHAFEENRKKCPICENFKTIIDDGSDGIADLLPTFIELADDGYCEFHP